MTDLQFAVLSYKQSHSANFFLEHVRQNVRQQGHNTNRMSKRTEPRTISFQPDTDVRAFLGRKVRSFKAESRRGVRTRIINECIRMRMANPGDGDVVPKPAWVADLEAMKGAKR